VSETLTLNRGQYPELTLTDAGSYTWDRLFSYWVQGDPFQPTEETKVYYETKAKIARWIKPKRVVEIGVRAGYSALAFYMGHPYQEFYGMDMDEGYWGGVVGYLAHALRALGSLDGPCSVRLDRLDSQSVQVLRMEGQQADLFHVDGNHTPKGAAHDILLALTSGARYIVVDDYDFTPLVAEGADWAIKKFGLEAWYVGDGGYRGNVVIKGKR
jgi:predicted O-methyltransferase YrrM